MTITDIVRPENRRNVEVPSAKMVLALLLASWLALFPLVQAFHIAGAGHSHRYCPEHSRFEEDLHQHGDQHKGPHVDVFHDHGPVGVEQAEPDLASQPHQACALCEALSKRTPFESSGRALFARTDQCHLAPHLGSGDVPFVSALLLFAPKHSPPA